MILEFIFRFAHVLFGIVWIGMLYYFNFVQTEYFKEAEADAKADAVKKLAPRALWWFRWGAMFTFLTGLTLLHQVGASTNILGMPVIWVGALAGILMFLNVWLIIWPNQQIVIGLKEGEGPVAAAKAAWHRAPIRCSLVPCCSQCWARSTCILLMLAPWVSMPVSH